LQSGLEKSSPSKLLKQRAGEQIVIEHRNQDSAENAGPPTPASWRSLRDESGEDDEETEHNEYRPEQKPRPL
jgi:hypothetical protein